MKAAVVYGENDIRITEVPTPAPGPGEVLVRVRSSGVCATDVKILGGSGLPKELPTILGHEVAGTVETLGPGVSAPLPGSRVAIYPIAACGECFFCRRGHHNLCLEPYGLAHGADGGFAEYLRVPEQIMRLGGVVDIGEMPFDMAVMAEPVSCCISAAETCGVQEGDNVLIIGCGPLGLLHTIVARSRGATVLVADVNAERLARAAELGANELLDPGSVDMRAEIRRLTGVGADVVIAALGNARAVEQALPLVRNRGVFNIFGGTPKGQTIKLDPRWLHYGEITLTGTFAASLSQYLLGLEFVREHWQLVSRVVTARCGLDGILGAVGAVKNSTELKTIIQFD